MNTFDTVAIYKQIKKQNGEAVAQIIREAVLLDIPDILHVLEFVGNNPNEVKELVPVIRELYKTPAKESNRTNKTPIELLDEAGYDAFIVKTEEQKNSIKKYFRSEEELCTFHDPLRHKQYYIIHAVKRGAEKIKPSKHPEREDDYGASVISIQIAKKGGFISIKNRYNHTVKNPDATFNNNPDMIIPGLTYSLQKYFHVNFFTSEHPLPDNFQIFNDQLIRYNYEIDNVYCCSDCIFSGKKIARLNKDYEIMLDYFCLNLKTGEIKIPYVQRKKHKNVLDAVVKILRTEVGDDWRSEGWVSFADDSAGKVFKEIFNGKKISVQVNKDNKNEKIIFADKIQVATVEKGVITSLDLPNSNIGNNFLFYNNSLKRLSAPNVRTIGSNFLYKNNELERLSLPSIRKIGRGCLKHNNSLITLDVPNGHTKRLQLLAATNILRQKTKKKIRTMLQHVASSSRSVNN